MQDLRSAYSLPAMNPQFPDQEHLKCPRCDSDNTKFCYYNNYNLSQPRHFCKNCRRYWTKGGTLRNIPVGGGTRKTTKRSSSSSARRSAASASPPAPPHPKTETSSPPASDSVKMVMSVSHVMDVSGSFGSLLGSGGGQFGNFFLDESPPAMQVAAERNGGYDDDRRSSGIVNQSGGWNGDINGWPHDLSIYTPGASSSTFH